MIDDPAILAGTQTPGTSKPLAPPLRSDDPGDERNAQQTADAVNAAFNRRPFTWKNIPLAPLAISREGDWQAHRTALGAPPLGDLIMQPKAMIPDALRVLWFLAHEPREWLSVPAMVQGPDGNWQQRTAHDIALEIETKIRDWADQHINPGEHALAVNLFYDILNGSRETRTRVKPDKHHDPERSKN